MTTSYDYECREDCSANSDESSIYSIDSTWDSEDGESDCDSLLGFDLSDAVDGHEFVEESGRRYHAYPTDAYHFPIDQKEQERLDIIHTALLRLFDGELHTSSIRKPERVLDVMSGAGAWAAEMAYKHPESLVYGMDLLPVAGQPPSNCFFDVKNVESSWSYPTNYFDLIHGRFMYGGITSWEQLIERAFCHIRPGGCLEMQEMPFELFSQDRPASQELPAVRLMSDLTRALGMAQKTLPYQQFEELLRNAGFVDIEVEERGLPIGPWSNASGGKEIGRLNMINMLKGSEGWTSRLLPQQLGRTTEEVKQLVQEAALDFKDRRNKLYTKLFVFRARKPAPTMAS